MPSAFQRLHPLGEFSHLEYFFWLPLSPKPGRSGTQKIGSQLTGGGDHVAAGETGSMHARGSLLSSRAATALLFIVDYHIGPLGFSELIVLLFVPGPFVAGIR
jgi:hypothetical protein